jgi:hypothetical protein
LARQVDICWSDSPALDSQVAVRWSNNECIVGEDQICASVQVRCRNCARLSRSCNSHEIFVLAWTLKVDIESSLLTRRARGGCDSDDLGLSRGTDWRVIIVVEDVESLVSASDG